LYRILLQFWSQVQSNPPVTTRPPFLFFTFDSTRILFSPPQICNGASVPSSFTVDFEIKEVNTGNCSDCKGVFRISYIDVTLPKPLACVPSSVHSSAQTTIALYVQNFVAQTASISCEPASSRSTSNMKMSGSSEQMAISVSVRPNIPSGFLICVPIMVSSVSSASMFPCSRILSLVTFKRSQFLHPLKAGLFFRY
jgi:hypothetical protein